MRSFVPLFLVLASCIGHKRAGRFLIVNDDGSPIVCETPAGYVPEYEACAGEFNHDLSGVKLDKAIGGWATGELVYVVKFWDTGNTNHYMSCMVDWQCNNPSPLPYDLGMGCIDQSRCCDLGLVKK